jgi:hypothetical protein
MSTDVQLMLLLFGPIVLIGAGLVFYGLRQRIRARASASWSSVQGTALSAEVKEQVVTSGKTHSRQTWYRPTIEYEYLVNGVRYQSNRIAFGNVSSQNEEDAQRLLDQTIKAGSVQVFYNPQNPQDTVLLNTGAPGSWGFILGGVAIILLPVLFWLYFFVLRK